jgi:hypothetical protein
MRMRPAIGVAARPLQADSTAENGIGDRADTRNWTKDLLSTKEIGLGVVAQAWFASVPRPGI